MPPALQLAFRPLFARALKLLVTTLLLPLSAAERRCLRDATATKEALIIASCVLEARIIFPQREKCFDAFSPE